MNRITKSLFGAVAVATIAISMTACDEKAAEVSKKADDSSSVVKDEVIPEPDASSDVVVEGASETEVDELEVPTTAKAGDLVEVGDWSVKVTEVALNANQVLANRDYYNEKPKGQFVLVSYEATYNGAERTADAEMDLMWTLTTNDQQIWDTDWQTTPADDEEWTSEARKGGTIRQQVMFDVDPAGLPGAILSVEGYDANFDTVYADFAL